jgi:hypothetical protein
LTVRARRSPYIVRVQMPKSPTLGMVNFSMQRPFVGIMTRFTDMLRQRFSSWGYLSRMWFLWTPVWFNREKLLIGENILGFWILGFYSKVDFQILTSLTQSGCLGKCGFVFVLKWFTRLVMISACRLKLVLLEEMYMLYIYLI